MPLNTTKVRIIEANFYLPKMTIKDDVVSANEKTLPNSPASYLYIETLTRKLAICLKTNQAFLGDSKRNLFLFSTSKKLTLSR